MMDTTSSRPLGAIHALFFLSGFPALLYQIVWQRVLLSTYGLDVQSLTIVVSAFMLGLGVGSLVGGAVSTSKRVSLIAMFAAAEFSIAVYGFLSLYLFRYVGEFTAGSSLFTSGLCSFLLILIPTLMMGASLPLLAEYLVRSSSNVGTSVGSLYSVNAFGSGLACFLATIVLMGRLGLSGCVILSASLNLLVGAGALLYAASTRFKPAPLPAPTVPIRSVGAAVAQTALLPFPLALCLALISGYLALSYEIIWYRQLSFAALDSAWVFPSLLGSYLFGLALGSRFVSRYLSRSPVMIGAIRALGIFLFASSLLSLGVGPCFALISTHMPAPARGSAPYIGSSSMLLLICFAAALFGVIFPLIAHVSIDPNDQPGAKLSYLYGANIVGSTLGTIFVGLIFLQRLSEYEVSVAGLLLGSACALAVLAGVAGVKVHKIAFGAILGLVVILLPSHFIYRHLYDRLLFKGGFPGLHFQQVISNSNGVIGVTPGGTVFGGGVYDGRFSTNIIHDTNIIVRPYALSAMHPAPGDVLMIGLGSGSWAQVIAHNPQVQRLTVVEINPGYLQLIPKYPEVASLLNNEKVNVIIDDGRRWLVAHPGAQYDMIVMNTTFHWRNHATALLSVEFLRMARRHLKPGGVLFYNTTGSGDVIATGLSAFSHAFRVTTCLALSDSPIYFDRKRWRDVLLDYMIDGKHVVNQGDPSEMKQLDDIVNIPDDGSGRALFTTIEDNDQLRARLHNRTIVTDDNMAVEWR